MAVSNSAASATLRAIGPAVSWLALSGTTCVRLTSPSVGLNPTTPLMLAGQMMEPSVSVPMAAQASWAATAAPLPLDEPQVLRSIAWGLRVSPPTALHPLVEFSLRKFAHSDRLVLPSTTPPAARKLAIRGASRPVSFPASARLPAVVGNSRVSILSFTSTVRPASSRRAASAAAASRGASGLIATTAFRFGPASSSAAIRPR